MPISILGSSVGTFADDIGFENGEEVVGDTVKTAENVDLFDIAKEMIDEVPDEDYEEKCSLPECLQELKDTIDQLASKIDELYQLTQDSDSYQPAKKGSPGRPDKEPPKLMVADNRNIVNLATKAATKAVTQASVRAIAKAAVDAVTKAQAKEKAKCKAALKTKTSKAKPKVKTKTKTKVKAKVISKKTKRR